MNNKILGYGSIALAILLLFAFAVINPVNDIQEHKASLIPNIASQTIEWNGNPLHDSTVFDEQSNVCTASRYGMEIKIWPCVAQDVDGKDIEQFVNFTWTGTQPQNTSWIFVYDGGQLQSGSMDVLQNVSYQTQAPGFQWINNYLVDKVVSYQNLGSPSGYCDLGSLNNTQMFNVTRNLGGNMTAFSQIYCFSTSQAVNATAFRISGNIDAMVNVSASKIDWNDVSPSIQYLGYGLLNDNRSYYRTQNIQFNPGQTIATRWIYTAKNASLKGKWHILGFDSNTGLTPSLAQDKYIYVDPWWDSNWQYKKQVSVQGGSAALTNFSVFINVSYNANMQNDFDDVRFVDSSETTELEYEKDYKVDGSFAGYWVKFPTLSTGTNTLYMYYGNAGAASTSKNVWDTSVEGAVWHLSENTGTATKDSYGTFNGTLTNTPTWTTGKFGQGLSFTGSSSQYVETSTGNSELFRVNSAVGFTMSVWMKTTTDFSATNHIMGSWDGSNNLYRMYEQASDIVGSHIQTAATETYANDVATTNDGTWHQFVFVYNASNNAYLFRDGVYRGSGAWNAQNFKSADGFNFGGLNTGANSYFTGQLDEVRVFRMNPNPAWIARDYQNGNSSNIVFGTEQQNSGVQTTLISPAASLSTNNPSVTFIVNSTASGSTHLSNMTLYIWNSTSVVYSDTQSISGTVNLTNWTRTLVDGSYTWNALTVGDDSTTGWGASNRSLLIDTTLPVIQILTPENGSRFLTTTWPYNVTFNVSIIEANQHACWFNNETGNTTFTCGQNVSQLFNPGWHTVQFYANDSASNVGTNQTSFLVNWIYSNITVPSPVVEGENSTIIINITANEITSVNATLTYNGTQYAMSGSHNGSLGQFSANVQAPLVSGNSIIPLWVNYTVNGRNFSSIITNQTVLLLTPIVVSTSCNDKAMNFTVYDEQTPSTALTANIAYNFQFGISNNSMKSVYGTLSNVGTFYVCINSTVSNAYKIGSGEIDYQENNSAYVLRRYYVFANHTLTNSTEKIALYDLANSAATSFLIEAKDQTLNPYVSKFLGLLRWYPALNTYNLIEMAQTDENGRSIMRVKSEDVDYRVALWELNGTLIKLNDPTRFACLTQPCTYSFTVFPTDQDYTSITGIQQSLTFNETSNKFVFVWNDPSQRTSIMNLTVYRETGVNVGEICNAVGTGYVGAISCDVSGYTGQLRAVVLRSASPPVPIAQLVWNLGQAISSVAASMGLFISVILAIAGFFIGIFSPIIGIIMQIASLIPSLYLGAVTQSVIIGFAIMGVIIIHFMRRIFS